MELEKELFFNLFVFVLILCFSSSSAVLERDGHRTYTDFGRWSMFGCLGLTCVG